MAAAYTTQAQRLAQRGALPEVVFSPPPDSSPAVLAAHRTAVVARVDADRREAAREQARRGAQRAGERQAWHAKHAGHYVAWVKRLDKIAARKASAIERDLQRGGDLLNDVDLMFGAIFAAEWRARRAARGEPEPVRRRRHRLSEAELAAVPW